MRKETKLVRLNMDTIKLLDKLRKNNYTKNSSYNETVLFMALESDRTLRRMMCRDFILTGNNHSLDTLISELTKLRDQRDKKSTIERGYEKDLVVNNNKDIY